MADRADAPRSLLFGLLALQTGMINTNALVAAFHTWIQDKSRPMGEILVEQGALDNESRALLEGLTAKHLEQNDDDLTRSLAALNFSPAIRQSLEAISDPMVSDTLSHVGKVHRRDLDHGDATASHGLGVSSANGHRFRVLRPHAQGGLGAVFVALDSELNREVALKQILDRHADAPVSRARFLLEAEITGGLEHPGIVPVYGLGTYENGRPYYAMRFIRGDSLKEAISAFHADRARRRDPGRTSLALRQLLRRFLDVCNAIDYAHSRGVLHRDIKPGNIIIGRHGETLVVDWGLAKPLGRSDSGAPSEERTLVPSSASGLAETVHGTAIGTPAYMSPEQAAGDQERLGPRSDVYSLGATLYCLLTGRPPREGENLGAVLAAARKGDFPPPRQLDPSIDRTLEAVCVKAMAPDPANRYATSKALVEDIERWMADEPVTARRESLSERARRWVRQHRTAATSVAASMLVAMVGLTAVLVVQRRANADLSLSNDRERARFDLAMDVIKRFHTGVSEDFLLKQKEFQELRTKLLTEAKDSYDKLQKLLEGQPDGRSRATMGKALYEFGELTAKIGSVGEALTVHEQALLIRSDLAAKAGADTESQVEEGRSWLAVGLLQAETGKRDQALVSFARARVIFEALTENAPNVAEFQHELAKSFRNIGFQLTMIGRPAEAGKPLDRARIIMETLVKENPTITDFRSLLADIHYTIATILQESGRPLEALASHVRVMAIEEALAKEHPEDKELQDALAQSLTKVGAQLWSGGKATEALELYQRARTIAEALVKENPNVLEFQRSLLHAHGSIGKLLIETGRPVEALASYEQARPIVEALVKSNPDVTVFQISLADVHNSIGLLRSNEGELLEALASYERSRATMDVLVRNNPNVTDYQFSLAAVHGNIGNLSINLQKPAEALQAFEHALAIENALVKNNPEVPGFQTKLASSLINFGQFRMGTAEPAKALSSYQQAKAILEVLVKKHPDDSQTQSYLALTQMLIGNVFVETGKPAEALPSFQEALRIADLLAKKNPNIPDFQNRLALSYHNIADLFSRTDRPAEAMEFAGHARDIWKTLAETNPDVAEYQSNLAVNLYDSALLRLRAGRKSEGRSDLRLAYALLKKLPAQGPQEIYKQACLLAILSGTAPQPGTAATMAEAQHDADLAWQTIGLAVAAGFRDAHQLRTDTDLDSIRSRPDFQQLLMELMDLEFPADPFSR